MVVHHPFTFSFFNAIILIHFFVYGHNPACDGFDNEIYRFFDSDKKSMSLIIRHPIQFDGYRSDTLFQLKIVPNDPCVNLALYFFILKVVFRSFQKFF